MVQTTKAYKVSWKQTLKVYKSNMGTNPLNTEYWKTSYIYIYKPKYHKCFKSKIDPWVLNQNNNPNNTARQIYEF